MVNSRTRSHAAHGAQVRSARLRHFPASSTGPCPPKFIVHPLTLCIIFSTNLTSYRSSMPGGRWNRGHQVPATQDADPDADPEAGPSQPQVSNLERPRECINRFPTPAFSLLCTMMDRLRTEEASKRRNTLERFFELWRIKVGNDLYPLIRLLLPDVSLPKGNVIYS
jgi:hypothetical protein